MKNPHQPAATSGWRTVGASNHDTSERLSVRTMRVVDSDTRSLRARDKSLDRALESVMAPPPQQTVSSSHAATGARPKTTKNAVGRLHEDSDREDHHGKQKKSIQDQIIATQMSRLNWEFSMHSVYQENRKVGISMAPPLSKLLLTESDPKVSLLSPPDSQLFPGMDISSIVDGAVSDMEMLKLDTKEHHVQAYPMLSTTSTWNHMHSTTTSKASPSSAIDISRRDEGDGRSMTDSNYSSNLTNPKPEMRQPRKSGDSSTRSVATVVAANASSTLHDLSGELLLPKTKADFHVPSLAVFNPAYEDEIDALPANAKLNASQASEIAKYLDKVIGGGGNSNNPGGGNKSSDVSEKSYSTGSTTITAGCVLGNGNVGDDEVHGGGGSAGGKDSRKSANALRKASSRLTSSWSKGFKVFSQHNQ
ncbi:unnamed protein product [Notodromas monacha]|uniref:Uncharacterized protein n=1 Tax=Notodromas monacha TaxID=399045 RepID=A0A7R9GB85_9CRUS|nr:unnamed protein product [Notodromas monacha]CAG0914765.1 unnamed protein product [Notodromas monacha]